MESSLGHGEGDLQGEDFRLTPHLTRALYRWFEYEPFCDADGAPILDETGQHAGGFYGHSQGLIGWPKGSIKTEFEAGLGIEHLEGPSWKFGTPTVHVAAVDAQQADELVRTGGLMVRNRALGDVLQVDNGRIIQRQGAGRMLATSAAEMKNDGGRTSLLLGDELHGWDAQSQAGARRWRLLARSTLKRDNGRVLAVSTAGWNLDTLLGAMYQLGCRIAAGELVDSSFLFEWWEASAHWDLDDPDQLVEAILESNPLARLKPRKVVNLVRGYHEAKFAGAVDEYLRYHLNRWVGASEDCWMAVEAWMARAVKLGAPKDGTDVVLGFDGSHNGDATALVGATIAPEPHLFVVDCWERDPRAREWTVPRDQVVATIEQSCTRWKVRALRADPFIWQESLGRLADRGVPVEEVPQTAKRMAPAAQRLYEAVTRGQMTHDGDPRMVRHIANCRKAYTGDNYVRVVKEHKHSAKHIDLAVAGIEAFELASLLGLGPRLAAATARAEGSACDLFRPRQRLSL